MVQKMQRNCFTLLLTFSATGYLMSVKNSYNWTLSSEDVFNNIESSSSTCWISALSFKLVKNCSVLGRWVLCWQPPSTDWSGGWGRGGGKGFCVDNSEGEPLCYGGPYRQTWDLPIIDYQLSFLFILAWKTTSWWCGGGSEHSICQQKEISTLIKGKHTMNKALLN